MNIKEKVERQFSYYKVLASWDRVEKVFEGKSPPPITAELHPAEECNLECVHCYNKDEREKSNAPRMDPNLLFDAIDTLIKGDVKGVVLGGGGEPLIHNQIKEAVQRLNKANIRVGLITNGVLLNEEISSILSQSKGFVRVSLDAYDEDSHFKVHNPKNRKPVFKKIINNIETLIKLRKEKQNNNLIIGVSYIVIPPFDKFEGNNDFEKIRCLCKLLKGIGIDYFQMRPVYRESQLLNEKEKNSKWVSDKRESLAQEFNDEHFFVVKTEARKGARENNGTNKGRKRYNKCFVAHLMPLLGADGTLYVCCQLQDKKHLSFCCVPEKVLPGVGNLLKKWESNERIETVNKIDVHKCPDCRFDELNEFLWGVYTDEGEKKIIRGILDNYKGNLTKEEFNNVINQYSQIPQKEKLNWDVDKIKKYLTSIGFTYHEKELKDNISPFLL